MEKELIIALVAAAVAVFSAVLSIVGQLRVTILNRQHAIEERRHAQMRSAALYTEPLARSAADLQSRIFQIVTNDFIGRYYARGSDREKRYAVANTTFLFAQFMAWTEAARLEVQYISLELDEDTKALSDAQNKIYSILQNQEHSPLIRIFAGEQRAIGERMLKFDANRFSCLGYGEFIDRNCLEHDYLFAELASDIKKLAVELTDALPRLVALQNGLVDLMNTLDKKGIRFPAQERTKIDLPFVTMQLQAPVP